MAIVFFFFATFFLDVVDCIFFVCLQEVNNKQEAVSIRKTNFSFIFFASDGATNIISLAYIFDTT